MEASDDDLLKALWPTLVFGRLIGIFPFGRSESNKNENSTFKRICPAWQSKFLSPSYFLNVTITFFLFINLVMSVLGTLPHFTVPAEASNVSVMANAFHKPFYYFVSSFGYYFFATRCNAIIQNIRKWQHVCSFLHINPQDSNLSYDVGWKFFIVLVSTSLQVAVNNLAALSISPQELGSNVTHHMGTRDLLEAYYLKDHSAWAQMVPYNPILIIFLLITDVLATFACSYGDSIILGFSRALHFKYKGIKIYADFWFDSGENVPWHEIRNVHIALYRFLTEVQDCLSPLIFTTYAFNVYTVSIQLHAALAPEHARSVYLRIAQLWTFTNAFGRIILITLEAGKINNYALSINETIEKCPTTCYTLELERLQRLLANGPIGFGGLNCFIVTRSFLLASASIIFTFEIVLLQSGVGQTSK